MSETDWTANFNDTSNDFATFDDFGTATFPAPKLEAWDAQLNKNNEVTDFDDPFSDSNDDLKIDD
eukprot:CAMPEP_0196765776 /NCGR_PEP_ID=MMETSP1095-20130614/12491_1 /TAXON_ID=96789 ORGANISM="Chromulina nebulosa, Strain UTEXLB2642" /NCGR_SAMPLE_ID=MMETSP1095 /ASSEMBLY_ACC=CAM_ASM_000446 /LENGTH=64 /DNA_ID=CAMNT_0042124499 /DNA_START=1917 /DNA_END=2108 /DNA_ORIENTATION=+